MNDTLFDMTTLFMGVASDFADGDEAYLDFLDAATECQRGGYDEHADVISDMARLIHNGGTLFEVGALIQRAAYVIAKFTEEG